jgi:energy-coupling factor transporter ATP-binding protein EcfA2
LEEKTQSEIKRLLEQADLIFKKMEIAENLKNEAQVQLTECRKKLDEARKKNKRSKKSDEKIIAEKEFETAQKDFQTAEKEYSGKVEDFEKLKQKTQELSEKVSICKACNDAVEKLTEVKALLDSYSNRQKELEHQYEISTSDKDQKAAYGKLQQVTTELTAIQKKYQSAVEEESFLKTVAAIVLEGTSYREAEVKARQELQVNSEQYSIFNMGEILMRTIPVFKFFEDFSSLLPNKIDLEDILNQNLQVEGYKAARNFLEIAGLDAGFFREKNHRILKQKIENLNGEITINFQDYWSQSVGRDSKICLNFELEHYDYTHPEKSGKPYLEFWIKDKYERLYPKQRSRGVRWFLSFYLELKATAKRNHIAQILLIDEPGLSLHARAQEDVLKVFEDLKDTIQIIYCTHSPHLIDPNKLYRILAIQRADELDDQSETVILDSGALYSASTDTLSPVYSLMGVRINNQDFIQSRNNIIVEDTLTYYYLNTFCSLLSCSPMPAIIPSTGLTNIPLLANVLLGWKVDFSILIMGESRAEDMLNEISTSFFFARKEDMNRKIIRITEFEFAEDVFSTLDFKKYVLQRREGITERNSDYIFEQGLSRTILASQFINYCEAKNIKINDFDHTTQENMRNLIKKIQVAIS